ATPAPPRTSPPVPPPVAIVAPPAAPAIDPALVEAMLRRGQALLDIGDISGARRFLERAAAGGSVTAAIAMAETFDPVALARRHVVGMAPDRAAALDWYRRAAALGSSEAAARIANLEAQR
ncbi:SEL1-like repeat protein, partial [Falsiroseomonas oryzae]